MVIRVNAAIVAEVTTAYLQRPVGDHLVGVHVDRGAARTFEHVDDEMFVVPAFHDLFAGRHDRVRDFRRQNAEFTIRQRGGFLDMGERADEGRLVAQRTMGDRKILTPSGGVNPVQAVAGERDFA